MYNRGPKEPFFHFGNRVLVCFAVDLNEVAMTTQLKGVDTVFLPFNQGSNGAGDIGDGGNPANSDGYPTVYLLERVLCRPMLLSLLQRYFSCVTEEKISLVGGKQVKKKNTFIIFPK